MEKDKFPLGEHLVELKSMSFADVDNIEYCNCCKHWNSIRYLCVSITYSNDKYWGNVKVSPNEDGADFLNRLFRTIDIPTGKSIHDVMEWLDDLPGDQYPIVKVIVDKDGLADIVHV